MLPITQKWTHLEKVSEDIIKLAGGNPDQSRWLVENLAGLTDALRWKKQIEDERPKKAELRKKLNNLHSAARLVEDSLKRRPRRNLNPDYTASVLELIHLVRPHLTPQLGSLAYLIHQYALAVEEAMTTISRKPGATRVKPPPSNLLDSMGWCALIICEVWRTCRAGYPGENNPKAQQAADLLWDAVLGTRSKLKAERWSRHLARAKKCEDWQTHHIRESLNLTDSELSSVPTESAPFSSDSA